MADEPKNSETTDKPVDLEEEAFMVLMRKRSKSAYEGDKKDRKKGQEDVRFINGEQWTPEEEKQRGPKRLTLTMNTMPTTLDQIDGDIRLSTPGLKVKAVDDAADTNTADVLEGLLRYIQRNSRATKVHSYAGLHAAASGRGAWRILTDFISNELPNGDEVYPESLFRQEIRIERIINAFAVRFDPAAIRDDKQDGMFFFIDSEMSKYAYKEEYKQEPVDYETDGAEFAEWQSEDNVRVSEYFYKEKVGEKTIYQLDDGSIVVEKPEDFKNSREIPIYKIKWAKVDGKRILEEGDIPGPMFPIILTWGKQLCVDGKIENRGIGRHSKHAAKMKNFFWSNEAESIALQPKQPYIIPDICMTNDYRKMWDVANDENLPFLLFKWNDKGAVPKREQPAMASSGNREMITMLDEAQRDTMGMPKAGVGKQSPEISGVALKQKKIEIDTGQFAFIDNLSDAIVTEGKIIIGMIPHIYDFETKLRILGKDMKEKLVTVNGMGGINLTTGKYDIDITTEGSYSTQREEFQDKITTILPLIPPEHVAAISDLLFEMQDFHRADDIAQRLKKLIPPELLENEDELDEESDLVEAGNSSGVQTENGVIQPGFEGEEEPPIDPQIVAELEAQQIELEKQQIENDIAQVKLEQEQAKLAGLELDNDNKKQLTKEDIMVLVEELMQDKMIKTNLK
jgi:hypothetical protein